MNADSGEFMVTGLAAVVTRLQWAMAAERPIRLLAVAEERILPGAANRLRQELARVGIETFAGPDKTLSRAAAGLTSSVSPRMPPAQPPGPDRPCVHLARDAALTVPTAPYWVGWLTEQSAIRLLAAFDALPWDGLILVLDEPAGGAFPLPRPWPRDYTYRASALAAVPPALAGRLALRDQMLAEPTATAFDQLVLRADQAHLLLEARCFQQSAVARLQAEAACATLPEVVRPFWQARLLTAEARFHLATGQTDRAEAASRLATSLSHRPECWLALATVHLVQGQAGSAQAAYEQVLSLEPSEAAVFHGQGNQAFDLALYPQAIAAYRRALANTASPALAARTRTCLGLAQYEAGELADAAETFAAVLGQAPHPALAQVGRAMVYLKNGRIERALAACQQALVQEPTLVAAHAQLGLIYRRLGRLEAAAAALDAAVSQRYAPAIRARDYYRLGNVHLARRDDPAAEKAFARAVALNPSLAAAHNGLGTCLARRGHYDQAITRFETAIIAGGLSNSQLAVVYNGLGNASYHAGRYEAAVRAYQQAVALNYRYARAYNGLGHVYRALGRFEEAEAAFRRAVRLDPDYAAPYLGLGSIYSATRRHDRARAALRQASALEPRSSPAYCALASLALRQGDSFTASRYLDRAAPTIDRESRYNQACYYALRGDATAALSLLAAALRQVPGLRAWAGRDPDLASLRDQPAFHRLVAAPELSAAQTRQPADEPPDGAVDEIGRGRGRQDALQAATVGRIGVNRAGQIADA